MPLCEGTPHEIKATKVELPPDFEEDMAWEWAQSFSNREFKFV